MSISPLTEEILVMETFPTGFFSTLSSYLQVTEECSRSPAEWQNPGIRKTKTYNRNLPGFPIFLPAKNFSPDILDLIYKDDNGKSG